MYSSPENAVTLDGLPEAGHRLESLVHSELSSHPAFTFSSLVVRRTEDGVCLQGFAQVDETAPDVCSLAQKVAGVNRVINQLVFTGKLP